LALDSSGGKCEFHQVLEIGRRIRWRKTLVGITSRLLLTEALGDSAASTLLVMFPSMRLRRIVTLSIAVLVLRSIVPRPGVRPTNALRAAAESKGP
jgi:hypothetical protein